MAAPRKRRLEEALSLRLHVCSVVQGLGFIPLYSLGRFFPTRESLPSGPPLHFHPVLL